MFYSFRQTNARFILNLSSRTLECHISLIIYCMTHVHQGHNFHLWSRTYKLTLSSPEHAPAYMMAANAGVIKAIVSFYRVNSDTAFERHRSRIPINDLNTVHALKKHLIQFLGLKELTIKYGLGDFDIKLYRMAPKPGGKSDNFAITTDDQWKLELPSMLDDSGSEMSSMYS